MDGLHRHYNGLADDELLAVPTEGNVGAGEFNERGRHHEQVAGHPTGDRRQQLRRDLRQAIGMTLPIDDHERTRVERDVGDRGRQRRFADSDGSGHVVLLRGC